MSDKTLRRALIKLAHEQPDLRGHLLPIITKKSAQSQFFGLHHAVIGRSGRVLYTIWHLDMAMVNDITHLANLAKTMVGEMASLGRHLQGGTGLTIKNTDSNFIKVDGKVLVFEMQYMMSPDGHSEDIAKVLWAQDIEFSYK